MARSDLLRRWTHIECELRYGPQRDSKLDPHHYVCYDCRNKPPTEAGSASPSRSDTAANGTTTIQDQEGVLDIDDSNEIRPHALDLSGFKDEIRSDLGSSGSGMEVEPSVMMRPRVPQTD